MTEHAEEARALWKTRGDEKFEDAVRRCFSPCDLSDVRIGHFDDGSLGRGDVEVLDLGGGIVRLEGTHPVLLQDDDDLAAPKLTLLFTLPEENVWRNYVVVTFTR
jgi:hypothetical protein